MKSPNLVDRALRNLPAMPGDPEWPGLAEFQARVRPLLLLSLRRALNDRGAAPDALATRRVFFTTAAPDAGPVTVAANYLFVTTTTVISPRRPIHRVADLTDRLTSASNSPASGSAEKMLNQALDSPEPVLDAAARSEMIRAALLSDPGLSLERIVSHFVGLRPPLPTPGPDPLYARRTIDQARSLESVGAFHAAMQVLVEFIDRATETPPADEFNLDENKLPEVPAMLVMLYVQIQQNTRRTRKPPDMWKRIGEWAAGNKPENMSDQVNKALALVAEWQPEKPGYLALCVKSKGLRPSKNMEAIAGLETCISLTPAGRIV